MRFQGKLSTRMIMKLFILLIKFGAGYIIQYIGALLDFLQKSFYHIFFSNAKRFFGFDVNINVCRPFVFVTYFRLKIEYQNKQKAKYVEESKNY